MGNFILLLIMITISFFAGIKFTLNHFKKVNKKYQHLVDASDYDFFKENLEYLNIGNILDVAHSFGFNEGWDERQRVEDNKIDEMLEVLSASTEYNKKNK